MRVVATVIALVLLASNVYGDRESVGGGDNKLMRDLDVCAAEAPLIGFKDGTALLIYFFKCCGAGSDSSGTCIPDVKMPGNDRVLPRQQPQAHDLPRGQSDAPSSEFETGNGPSSSAQCACRFDWQCS
jgi:hypothetical protein